jgi:hypothetical protein
MQAKWLIDFFANAMLRYHEQHDAEHAELFIVWLRDMLSRQVEQQLIERIESETDTDVLIEIPIHCQRLCQHLTMEAELGLRELTIIK